MGDLFSGSGQWQSGQQPSAGNGGPTQALFGGQGGPNDLMFGLGGATPEGGMITGVLSGGNTPQMRGFGIQEPPPFTPYSPGGGLTFNPNDPYAGQRNQQSAPGMTTAPVGWDMSSPGVAEQWQQQNQGAFLKPTAQENFWQAHQGDNPNLMTSPNLDPYYNNAERRATEGINQQMGARGLFNSSAALGQGAEAIGNLEAEKANREAQYGLERSQNILDWTRGLGGLAGQADQSRLANLGAGFGAAQSAEDARRQRGRDYMSDLFNTASPVMSAAGQAYSSMLGGDEQLMRDAMMAEMGLAGEAQANDYRTQEKMMSDTERTAGLFGNVLGGVMGGKGK